MKHEDFELSPPQSLRDVVLTELENENVDNWQAGKPVRRLSEISDKEIEDILKRVYEHIEFEYNDSYKDNSLYVNLYY